MKRKTQLGILILTAILLLTSVQIGSGEEVINIYNYIKKSDDIRWANKNICLVGCKIPENPDKCECATVYEITPKELTFVQDGIKLDSKNLWFMFRSKNKINLVNNLAQNFDWKNVWYWINVTKIGYNIEYDGSYYPCGIYEYDRKTYNKTCYNDTLIKNESYLYESWEPFAFDKPILSKDIKLGITGWKRLGSDVDHIPNFKIKNRNYTLSDVDWWNSTWLNRRNITVRNNELYSKGEELQYIYSIPGVYPNGCSNEARLIDHSDNSPIPFDVLNSTLTTCKIAFITSLAGSSSKTYGFYYNSTTAVAPVETSFLHLYDDFNDSTLSNVGDQAYNGVGLADYSNANVESVSGGILAVAVNGDGAPRFEHENLPITVPMSSAQLYFVQDFISSLNEHGFGLGSGSSTMRAAYATEGNLGRVFYYYDGSYSLLASSGWGSSIDIVGRIHIDTSANLGIYTIYDGTHSNTLNATHIINDNSYSSLAFYKKDPAGANYRVDRYGIGNLSFNFYNQRSVITIGSQEAYVVPNQPPIITAINISSENGLNLTNEDLIGDFVYYDPDSDPESSNQTKWFKDGVWQASLTNLMRINKGNTSVGNSWIFSAKVNDGTLWSNWYNSSALVILNSPPSISIISLTSSDGTNRTSANLYGNYTFDDIDNDSEANKETKWFKNNIEQGSLNNLMSIASSNTSKGENWIFSARVNDGTAWSNWYNSSLLLIVNTPPTAPILSSPPDGAVFNQTKELNWTNSVDADNESLTYRLELDDNNTFVSLIYINVSIAEDPSGITGDPKAMLGLNLADDKAYYWRVLASDGVDNSSWSDVRSFTYAMWNITFDVRDSITNEKLDEVNITCNGWNNMNSVEELVAEEGMIGLWHMNEASGTIMDYSGNGNNGTTYGSLFYGAGGKFNTALSFDGVNDYADFGNKASLNISSNVTVGAWMYKNVNFVNDQEVIVDKVNQYAIIGRGTTEKVDFAIFQSGAWQRVASASVLENNVWYHTVGVYNGSNLLIYINGILSNSTLKTGSIASGGNLYFGAYGPSMPTYNFNGVIDEVSIYDRSLTAGEVLEDYEKGVPHYDYSHEFALGSYDCIARKDGSYYKRLQSFTADQDKIVTIILSQDEGLTEEEHTWLEAIHKCVVEGDCHLLNLLEQINQSVDAIWKVTKRTDESVVSNENVVSYEVSATSNLTINYTINIPIKHGYSLGDYLPIRIGYWFMDTSNATCYNQGDKPTGVESPYCQPLIIQTLGPMGSSTSFSVDLRPELPAGTYTIIREIDIDPNELWTNYGRETIGTVTINEDNEIASISLASDNNRKVETQETAASFKEETPANKDLEELKEKVNSLVGITGNLARNLQGKGNLFFTIGFFALITLIIGYVIGKKAVQKRN